MDFERLLIISIQSETLVPFPGKGINYTKFMRITRVNHGYIHEHTRNPWWGGVGG